MSVINGEIIKAGWLHRQSSVLKKWKRHWFTLTRDGILRYYDHQHSYNAEDAARMKVDCLRIRTGNDILNVSPPDGCGRSSLLSIEFKNKHWNLCAESPDDMQAWKFALEDSRVLTGPPPSQYRPSSAPVYPTQHTVHTYPGQQVIHVNPGQQIHYGPNPQTYVVPGYSGGTVIQPGQPGSNTTVIVQDDPYYYGRRRYDGGDVAMGVVAGAAVGSMMWGPMLWW